MPRALSACDWRMDGFGMCESWQRAMSHAGPTEWNDPPLAFFIPLPTAPATVCERAHFEPTTASSPRERYACPCDSRPEQISGALENRRPPPKPPKRCSGNPPVDGLQRTTGGNRQTISEKLDRPSNRPILFLACSSDWHALIRFFQESPRPCQTGEQVSCIEILQTSLAAPRANPASLTACPPRRPPPRPAARDPVVTQSALIRLPPTSSFARPPKSGSPRVNGT